MRRQIKPAEPGVCKGGDDCKFNKLDNSFSRSFSFYFLSVTIVILVQDILIDARERISPSVTGIPRTLYEACSYRFLYLSLLYSYTSCSRIYFSITSPPFPTDPWKQLGDRKWSPFNKMRKFLSECIFLCVQKAFA